MKPLLNQIQYAVKSSAGNFLQYLLSVHDYTSLFATVDLTCVFLLPIFFSEIL